MIIEVLFPIYYHKVLFLILIIKSWLRKGEKRGNIGSIIEQFEFEILSYFVVEVEIVEFHCMRKPKALWWE